MNAETQHERFSSRCGNTSSGESREDSRPQCEISYWKCSKRGFLIIGVSVPVLCPECGNRAEFVNVTRFILCSGNPGHDDLHE